MASMLSVYMAIQLCRRTARCGRPSERSAAIGRRQCCRAPGSRLGKHSCLRASFAVTHQVKLSMSFLEHTLKKSGSPFPRAFFFNFVDAPRRPGCTGGFTSPSAHSYAGSCPFGCMYHSRRKRTSVPCKIRIHQTPGARSEMPDPQGHTKGIPTCRAWKLHRLL